MHEGMKYLLVNENTSVKVKRKEEKNIRKPINNIFPITLLDPNQHTKLIQNEF